MAILSSPKSAAAGGCGPWTITTGVLSFVCILAGLLAGFLVPMFVDDGLTQILVCDKDSAGFDGFKSNRNANTPTFVTNILYNITNPTEFVSGTEPAEIVESQQYVYRKRSRKFDISFGHFDAEGYETVRFKVWDQYTFEPSRSCAGCSDLDEFYTMSIPYSQVLTQMVSEAGFAILQECGDEQIAAMSDNGLPVCANETERRTPGSGCRCCAHENPADPNSCAKVLSPENARSAALLSFLARMDRGVFVRDFGGSGESILEDSHGVHTPVVVKMSVRELLLGFPSAIGGFALGSTTANRDNYFLRMADAFTTDYGKVCEKLCPEFSTASVGAAKFDVDTCDATIPGTNEELEALGFSSQQAQQYSYLRKMSCSAFPWLVLSRVMALFGSDSPQCVDEDKMAGVDYCCLWSGTYSGTPLKGFGCLVEVGGGLNERMMDTLEEAKTFTAGTDFYVREMRTGCGAKMNSRDKSDREVQTIVEYKTKSSNPVWMLTADPDAEVTPAHLALARDNTLPTVELPVEGAYGAGVYPKGLSGDFFSEEVSDGKPLTKRFRVFPVTTRRGLDFKFDGTVTVNGIKGARFVFDHSQIDATAENRLLGQGQPYKGLIAGYFYYDSTAIIHEPLFAYGDHALLEQSDNSDLSLANGEALNIYQTMSDYIKYTPLDTPRLVTSELLAQYEQDGSLLAYVVVEPASGNYIEGHNRIASSFQTWKCDPLNPMMERACGMMVGGGSCYLSNLFPCSTANVLTPGLKGGKIIPVAVTDEYASISNDDAATLEAAGQAVFISRILLVVLCGVGAFLTAFSIYLYTAGPADQGANNKRKSYEAGVRKSYEAAGVPSTLANLYGHDDRSAL